jgi:hypothetical protein
MDLQTHEVDLVNPGVMPLQSEPRGFTSPAAWGRCRLVSPDTTGVSASSGSPPPDPLNSPLTVFGEQDLDLTFCAQYILTSAIAH